MSAAARRAAIPLTAPDAVTLIVDLPILTELKTALYRALRGAGLIPALDIGDSQGFPKAVAFDSMR
jgi:hypothetical protein